jgi:hypothetical protein
MKQVGSAYFIVNSFLFGFSTARGTMGRAEIKETRLIKNTQNRFI